MILTKPKPKIYFREKFKGKQKDLKSNFNCFVVDFN